MFISELNQRCFTVLFYRVGRETVEQLPDVMVVESLPAQSGPADTVLPAPGSEVTHAGTDGLKYLQGFYLVTLLQAWQEAVITAE